MYRFFALLTLAFCCSDAPANDHRWHHHSDIRYGHYAPGWNSGGWNIAPPVYPGSNPSFGFGYTYDPYSTGRFVAPDLLNDPYYLYQHRTSSHFPGHSKRRPPLQFKYPQ